MFGIGGHLHQVGSACPPCAPKREERPFPLVSGTDGVTACSPGTAVRPIRWTFKPHCRRNVVVDHQALMRSTSKPRACHIGGPPAHSPDRLRSLSDGCARRWFWGTSPFEDGHVVRNHLLSRGFRDRQGDGLGASKDDHPSLLSASRTRVRGFRVLGSIDDLDGADEMVLDSAPFLADGDFSWILEIICGRACGSPRDLCGKQHHLACSGSCSSTHSTFVDEPSADLIGFVRAPGCEVRRGRAFPAAL